MKRMLAILAVCGLGGVALAQAVPTPPAGSRVADGPAPADRTAGNLVVHEWGTFTGFAGSDGVHLPFGIDVGSELPPFVLNRASQVKRQGVEFSMGYLMRKADGVYALQRMETPVIYFYTDRPRDVEVAVDFPQGLLTEFYPPVRGMSPAFGEGPGEYGAIATGDEMNPFEDVDRPAPRSKPKMTGGSLDWGTVQITPQAPGQPSGSIPDVPAAEKAASHYGFARETEAATVRFSDDYGAPHEERFLFYRGLGDFTLPVTLTAAAGDRFELINTGEHPIRFALLLRTVDGGARFAVYRDIQGAQSMSLPTETVALEKVGGAITRALVAEGLYEKEARAMVKTWASNWLGEPGTRVLYTVPEAVTDDLLPLRISLTPHETVRVLVGRIDVITPEDEAKIQSLLAASVQAKTMSIQDAEFLRSLGRFYGPAVDRAAKLRGSAESKLETRKLRSLLSNAPKAAETAVSATLR